MFKDDKFAYHTVPSCGSFFCRTSTLAFIVWSRIYQIVSRSLFDCVNCLFHAIYLMEYLKYASLCTLTKFVSENVLTALTLTFYSLSHFLSKIKFINLLFQISFRIKVI